MDLLEAYTLGVLEPDEAHAVERHLAMCTECRRLAADLAATADLLPLALAAASSLRPPADLKDRVLRAAQGSAMVIPETGSSTRPNATSAEASPRVRILPGRV
jgi:anti-sigma factor RsiW